MKNKFIMSGTWEEVIEKLNELKEKYGKDKPVFLFIDDTNFWLRFKRNEE